MAQKPDDPEPYQQMAGQYFGFIDEPNRAGVVAPFVGGTVCLQGAQQPGLQPRDRGDGLGRAVGGE